jgi:tRNA dimethylallyltransferase
MKSGGNCKRIVIAGPTGIGKTAVSIELVKLIREHEKGASIISADSRQCYRYLDIGTGKITPEEMGDIPHHNISIFNPDEKDTAAAFAKRTHDWEDEICKGGDIPIIVGGSTLHLQSLIWPLDDIPGACVYNQLQLSEQEKEYGTDFIFNKLKLADPEYVQKMDGYNRNRVFRALDVFMQTGKAFSSYHADQNLHLVPGDTHLIVLTSNRNELIQKIEHRVDEMLKSGLVEETERVLEMGFSSSSQSLQTVGYKETIHFLNNKLSLNEMSDAIKANTRQYAKRQATWFRRWKSAHFIDVTGLNSKDLARQIFMSY